MHDHNDSTEATRSSVLYLGADPELPKRMAPLLAAQGIQLHTADERDGQAHAGPGPKYLALILDTALLVPGQTLKHWLEALEADGVRAQHLLIIARTKEIGMRLQALRANAAACLVAPVATDELVASLLLACRSQPKTARRILVVDDDAAQTLLAERFLTSAGFQVRALTDPLNVLEVLAVFEPDLILMDLHMPGANGAELATIIREQDPFRALPILFLSAERDPERQLQALNMGGDAFITKPINPGLLAKMVTQRIDAYDALRHSFDQAEHRDPATGLATRRHFMMVLERAIAEPADTEPGAGLVLLTVDGAGDLAQRLGPGGLDLVRERLGQRLREQLGAADLAVCLDDHYHALLLRRPDPEALREAAQGLREALVATPLAIAGQSLGVRLSIGLGLLCTGPGDALTLISRAQKACAEAQRAGGDRLVIYQPSIPGPQDVFHEQRIDRLIEQALADSTPDQGFRLFYQPLVAVGPPGRHCLEVLLRLIEEDGALMPSRDFLPIAERSGRTKAIDRWVMMHALAVLARQSQAQPGLGLLIRQHLETLTAPGWLHWLRDQLSANGLTLETTILGLVVRDLLEHRGLAVLLAKILRKIGVAICLLEVDQTAAALDLVMELRPALVRLAPDTVREAKPERLNALVRRLRQQETEVIAAGIDKPNLIGPVWASGVRYAQGTLIQPPLAQPVFDWDEVVVG